MIGRMDYLKDLELMASLNWLRLKKNGYPTKTIYFCKRKIPSPKPVFFSF